MCPPGGAHPEIENPPSTTSVWPLIIAASGRHSRYTAFATSSGPQHRSCRRTLREITQELFAIRKVRERIGVDDAGTHRVDADATRAELLRERAHKRLERRLRRADESVAGHRALRAETRQRDDTAAVRIIGTARCARRSTASAFVSMHQRQCLRPISMTGFSTPDAALLTTMSRRSKCSRNAANSSSTLSGTPYARLDRDARRPSARISTHNASASSWLL